MYKLTVLLFLIIAMTSFSHIRPSTAAQADKESKVSMTPHNLSSTGPGGPGPIDVTTPETTEVCVFCHTPHGANNFPGSPLWNREVNDTYTPYTSSSLDAETIMGGSLDSPAGSSKLCLSCHDGLLALGTVNVFAGQSNVTLNTSPATMPSGEGVDTGFTRNLGTDLGNDHPIGLTYTDAVAILDKELFLPDSTDHIYVYSPGVPKPAKPYIPLEPTTASFPVGDGQIQCATCHDPHLYDPVEAVDPNGASIKFLRLNRFQQGAPIPGVFNEATDMVCLACHNKAGWTTSAHADLVAANETYQANLAGTIREIPDGMPVWKVGCLNCHDTHTVHGARRLLREGTDGPVSAGAKQGGDSAIEETCYQCHSNAPIITNALNDVPDIKTDFGLLKHMPITTGDQQISPEQHDITDSDFSETRALLGRSPGDNTNRHAECTDCHNPHRLMKDRLFSGDSGDTSEGTHEHDEAGSTLHTNIASGVLRGIWGVEPIYSGEDFLDLPLRYEVKDGDGGLSAPAGLTGDSVGYLTREYQVCLKCHSDYGYEDDGAYPDGGRPLLGVSGGSTASGTNNMTQYTNQAMEFQAPLVQQNGNTGNRSWHPVIDVTGRTAGVRNMSSNNNMFLPPWGSGNIGNQTMYCSDCHGSDTAQQTVIPSGNNPWGPHGSNNDFILKGTWANNTGSGGTNDPGICFKCHNAAGYATGTHDNDDNGWESGFGGNADSNLHAFHRQQVGKNLRCNWCHVAVPHGWKNKAFLVNLNDVGEEAGFGSGGNEITINGNSSFYNQGPYYNNAKLKIQTFSTSGTWTDGECGSSGSRGREWMRDVCDPPGGP